MHSVLSFDTARVTPAGLCCKPRDGSTWRNDKDSVVCGRPGLSVSAGRR